LSEGYVVKDGAYEAIEERNKRLIETFGGDTSAWNIDRILRLPSTINIPTKTKRKAGKVRCGTHLIEANAGAFGIDTFPMAGTTQSPTQKANGSGGAHPDVSALLAWLPPTASLPPLVEELLGVEDLGAGKRHGDYATRSELLFAALTTGLRAGCPDDMIVSACLCAPAGSAICGHCEDNSDGPHGYIAYVERQLKRAKKRVEKDRQQAALPPPAGNGNANGHFVSPAASPGTQAPHQTQTQASSNQGPIPNSPQAWPKLDDAAYYGLAGEVVRTLLPETESDPAALLLQYLTSFGNMVGRTAHVRRANTSHFANLFVLIVGRSARSRKGTSAQDIRNVMEHTDANWLHGNVKGGISSGEGIIENVRDASFAVNKRTKMRECVDEGVRDKRMLLDEREFSSALAKMKQDTNIVSRILREAWDSLPVLRTMTKHQPSIATKAHISVVGHITLDEVCGMTDRLSITNGFGNRFLYACIDRSKLLPEGGNFDLDVVKALALRTRAAMLAAQDRGQVTVADDAKPLWAEFYRTVEESAQQRDGGLIEHLTARAAPQTLRLALVYALLDGAPQIAVPHFEAAIALWRFCEDSARYIFASLTSDHTVDEIMNALEDARPNGLNRRDLFDHFCRQIRAHELTRALKKLEADGKVTSLRRATAGRPAEFWFAS
jgi:hypothetical protein